MSTVIMKAGEVTRITSGIYEGYDSIGPIIVMRHSDLEKFVDQALGSVRKIGERRSGKAKTGEEQPGSRSTLRVVNEHSEPVFHATSPSAATFRTEPKALQTRALIAISACQ